MELTATLPATFLHCFSICRGKLLLSTSFATTNDGISCRGVNCVCFLLAQRRQLPGNAQGLSFLTLSHGLRHQSARRKGNLAVGSGGHQQVSQFNSRNHIHPQVVSPCEFLLPWNPRLLPPLRRRSNPEGVLQFPAPPRSLLRCLPTCIPKAR
ncbi:hypothetical protein BDP81DRAFT_439577 [Colletotrichum phormii]|uniref:Uncharacterized protein n=1 Tax=Colletotrichum phormii TaxID=359342 RepID=A0AAI9ZF68_9PEZI|nr:uncharacterized protein BDP81DRAFT_439577 [Colletotrichum phormii]KAK1623442.1 hypothetical protein BDP81DRAFT_439577 [Colletotrichum phormii]